jgi:hypothetical protein
MYILGVSNMGIGKLADEAYRACVMEYHRLTTSRDGYCSTKQMQRSFEMGFVIGAADLKSQENGTSFFREYRHAKQLYKQAQQEASQQYK